MRKLASVRVIDAISAIPEAEAIEVAPIVTGKQIGRASCRERVSAPV